MCFMLYCTVCLFVLDSYFIIICVSDGSFKLQHAVNRSITVMLFVYRLPNISPPDLCLVIISLAYILDIKHGFICTKMVVTVEASTVAAAAMEMMKGGRGNLGDRQGQ